MPNVSPILPDNMSGGMPPELSGAMSATDSQIGMTGPGGTPALPGSESDMPIPAINPGMTPEEMKAEIDNDLSNLDSKASEVKAKRAISEQNILATKNKVLGALFDMLKKAGVDPNDLESIRSFLASLEEQDPDLAQLFEEVFNSIGSMDSKMMYPNAPQPPEPGLMDKFKNLGAGIMMPPEGATPSSEPGMMAPPPTSPAGIESMMPPQ